MTPEEKRKQYQKAYYDRSRQDPEKVEQQRKRSREWNAAHKDVIAHNMKKYYEANKEKHLAVMREYHAEHRDVIREQERQRRKARKEAK